MQHRLLSKNFTRDFYPLSAQLQKIFDLSPDVICLLDGQGYFQAVGIAASTIWGFHPLELTGTAYLDLVVEENRLCTHAAINNVMQSAGSATFQNRCKHKDGTVVIMSWSAQWDAAGNTMCCIGRAVSESPGPKIVHAHYERKVKKQNQEMRDMLECIPEGFFALDKAFNVIYWNFHAAQILKREKEEVLGKSLWDCFPGIEGTPFYLNYNKALAEQKSVYFEAFFEPLQAWYEVAVHPSSEGLSVFFKDITEQKKAKDLLRRLCFIAEQTDNLVVLTDHDGKITWVNHAFTATTEYSFAEACGHKPGDLLQGPETDKNVVAYMSRQLRLEKPFTVEVLNYTKSKRKYWLEIFCQPLYNEQGAFENFFALQTDITERKSMEETMQAHQKSIAVATIKAQERERAIVGQELHDNVNQVLTSVKLYLELCLSGIGNREELEQKSVDLVQLSINELRSLSKRLSAPTLGNIRLSESVRELAATVEATNKFKVALNTTVIDELEADPELHLAVYRILQEHLTNILKHAEASSVTICFEIADNDLVMRVSDNGKGFDTQKKRTGIGITNMKTRSENLNGMLAISSAVGKGCRLSARFPLAA